MPLQMCGERKYVITPYLICSLQCQWSLEENQLLTINNGGPSPIMNNLFLKKHLGNASTQAVESLALPVNVRVYVNVLTCCPHGRDRR